MSKMITIWGHSHIAAISAALQLVDQKNLRLQYRIKSGFDFRSDGWIVEPIDGNFETYWLNTEIAQWLRNNVNEGILVIQISGSDYLPYGISAAQAFDVILPFDKTIDQLPSLTMIPYLELKSKIKNVIRHILLGIPLIKQEINVPVIYLETPPPIGDNEYIRAHPSWAAGLMNEGIADPLVRYKLWRIHSQLIQEACEKHGVRFISLPSSVLDERGFLHPSAYDGDVMHANAWYGHQLLSHLDSVL
ncbi:hypothetical protein MKK58_03235 [Methylobacterium sp. J-078]|uniref:hypothetical protein n=1 Tax=Methylobacterium sp. J-078 TaxID=2836657 RepID=UPI001FB94A0A|nr:hypothetical protein [Methylobacterium sp. J-078]MCJ2043552.1 hypothetical protein [Methylobacterium sp. J-078]